MDYVVKVNGLTKQANGKRLIADINLHIKKGEIYGLLGQNGAGKTTIMKMLTGITRPTSGEIMLFGQPLTERSKMVLNRVGSVIEYPIFFEHLTAMDNLKLHCEYIGYYDEKAIRDALELVQLRGVEDKKVKDFSLGMKQRLGVARAIVAKPELLILDEPTNGLDPIGIKDMRDIIRMLSREYGITLLLSSHILAEMEQVVDRIGVIEDGRLTSEITLEEIRKQHTNYIELSTGNVEKTVFLLETELGINNMKIVQGDRIRIYDLKRTQNEITELLIRHRIELESIQKYSHSLEDYFYQKINGGGKVG